MDPRIRYVVSRAAGCFGLAPDALREGVTKQGFVPLLSAFLTISGPTRLFITYDKSAPPRKRVHVGSEPVRCSPSSKVFWILKPAGRALSPSSVEHDTVYGQISGDVLSGIQTTLTDIMSPALRSGPAPSDAAKRERDAAFFVSMRKFTNSVNEAHDILSDRIVLRPVADFPAVAAHASAVADLRAAAKADPSVLAGAEALVSAWCEQLVRFLAESEQIRKEEETLGPDTELTFWRARMAKFMNVRLQTSGRALQNVVSFVRTDTNAAAATWDRAVADVERACNESADNVKYLSTLEHVLELLYNTDPQKMTEAIPGLLSAVQRLHAIAQYYSSSERMTSLFVKISNQMIIECREYILAAETLPSAGGAGNASSDAAGEPSPTSRHSSGSGALASPSAASPHTSAPSPPPRTSQAARDDPSGISSLWSKDPDALIRRMHECIRLRDAYRREYLKVKRKAAQTPDAKPFAFSESYLFGNLDLFCKRLTQLCNVINLFQQFDALTACTLPDLGRILAFADKFMLELKRSTTELLDHRSRSFAVAYKKFKGDLAEFEAIMKRYIDNAFARSLNTRQMILVHLQFRNVLIRETFKRKLLEKQQTILASFFGELEHVRVIYEGNKRKPLLSRNVPAISGAVAWARLLLTRIEEPMSFFRARPQALANPLGRKVAHLYNRIANSLIEYEHLVLSRWQEKVAAAFESLNATLLVRGQQGEQLFVNLDPGITEICREVSSMARMGLPVPAAARAISHKEAALLGYKDRLSQMLESTECALGGINPIVRDMMTPHISELKARILPGRRSISWTSLTIDSYIHAINRQVLKIQEINKTVNDILKIRVKEGLRAISSTCLLPLPAQLVSAAGTNGAGAEKEGKKKKKEENGMAVAPPIITFQNTLSGHTLQAVRALTTKSEVIAAATTEVIKAISTHYNWGRTEDPQPPTRVGPSRMRERPLRLGARTSPSPISTIAERDPTTLAPMPEDAPVDGATMDASLPKKSNPNIKSSQLLTSPLSTSLNSSLHRTSIFKTPLPTLRQSRVQNWDEAVSAATEFLNLFHNAVETAILISVERTLRAFTRRLNCWKQANGVTGGGFFNARPKERVPAGLFAVDIELFKPDIAVSPSWDNISSLLKLCISATLDVPKMVPRWKIMRQRKGDFIPHGAREVSSKTSAFGRFKEKALPAITDVDESGTNFMAELSDFANDASDQTTKNFPSKSFETDDDFENDGGASLDPESVPGTPSGAAEEGASAPASAVSGTGEVRSDAFADRARPPARPTSEDASVESKPPSSPLFGSAPMSPVTASPNPGANGFLHDDEKSASEPSAKVPAADGEMGSSQGAGGVPSSTEPMSFADSVISYMSTTRRTQRMKASALPFVFVRTVPNPTKKAHAHSLKKMRNLFGKGGSFFSEISRSRCLLKLVISTTGAIAHTKAGLDAFIADLAQFSDLWQAKKDETFAAFLQGNPTVEEFALRMSKYAMLEKEIEVIPSAQPFGALQLNVDAFKTALLAEVQAWKQQFGMQLNESVRKDLTAIIEFMNETHTALSADVDTLDDVRAAMASLAQLREIESEIDLKIVPIEETYAILLAHDVRVTPEEIENLDQMRYRMRQAQALATGIQDKIKEIQPRLKEDLVRNVKEFLVDVRRFKAEYDRRGPNIEGLEPRVAVLRLKEFQAMFNERERKWHAYQDGERLFGFPITPYPELVQMKKELRLLNSLYGLYTDVLTTVSGYSDQLWVDLDFDQIAELIQDYQNRCWKLPKGMREWDAYLELRKTIDDFLDLLPLFQLLSHGAIRDRHWKAVSQLCGVEFDVDDVDNFKLKHLLAAPLLEHKDDIEDIGNAAQKETDIEQKINEIVEDWKDKEFTFDEFKNRGLLTLKASETSELIEMLEDTQMALGSLVSNRYNAPFKELIVKWVRYLATCDEIVQQWLAVQQSWIYLEAVFSGGDIARQLPQEARRFAGIDKAWVRAMGTAVQAPNVIFVTNTDDTLRSLLPQLSEQLEICQKSLSGYLEAKRNLFPRFYFVSDPVLLEILGQQSNPVAIQAHLSSIFDSVNRVEFDKVKRNQIVGLFDSKGEHVPLSATVTAQGNIEDWLNELIAVMQRTMRDIIRQGSAQVVQMDLPDFVESFPAQVSLLGIQLLWTLLCENALRLARSNRAAMAQTNKKNNDLLNQLVKLTTQDLAKRMRTCVETLVTIQVHQRDIFEELVQTRVRSPLDFEWLKQTRFYWLVDRDTCRIQITDIDFEYNYEYLGTQERLVITPLTDRCYITLAQAIGMYLGGAPAGPAGTGKTETVKDMGKTMGMYVVVFNCSDQMDYKGLGKIFRGLAQAGCWGDFDEFNRIELDVLSVAAQQLNCILTAMKEHRREFLFTDGQVVPLNPAAAFFITMNPGYAGRQELPENLKALFRTVAMMVPDREIIIRVKLASAGFQKSTTLAKKFFILYQLCEEQLSQQRHYDFGLRNILSVLRTCGARRRSHPDQTEEMILMRVLLDMNMSKLVDEDEPLFVTLTEDLFPGLKVQKATYPDLEGAIEQTINELGLTNHPSWFQSIIQLYETSLVRHGIMVLGPSQAGKSRNIETLSKSLSRLGTKHTVIRMNPKAITAPQMFGKLTVATGDWTDGIFSTLWRRAFKRQGDHMWIVLDGPVDTIWIESLNTVLDDNKTLTLANSDRIPMSTTLKLIFEVHTLENASPATVSRAGMIFMSASALGWLPIFKAWVEKRPDHQSNPVNECIQNIFKKCLQTLVHVFSPIVLLPEVSIIRTFLSLLDALLPAVEREARNTQELPAEHVKKIVAFALMWTIGGLLELDDRNKLSEMFATEFTSVLPLPNDLSVSEEENHRSLFDYFVDETGEWRMWESVVEPYIYPDDADPPFRSILVPTVDNTCTTYLLDKLIQSGSNVMLIGESGSGKTVNILRYLENQDSDKVQTRVVNFSSATTPEIFQTNVEGFVEKRMGSTYGPKAGRSGLLFVDDINMPTINCWGDQETNEFTRQLLEDGGFYSLDRPGDFYNIVDITYMAAMPHPGGGRNDIPSRLKGHFSMFNITLPGAKSLDNIFGTIVKGHYCENRGFSSEICETAARLVSLTRTLWQATKKKMLPTPAKLHYIFNLRDLSRINQGFINSQQDIIKDVPSLLSLWQHECSRVLPDKFTCNEDIEWFNKEIVRQTAETLGPDASRVVMKKVYFLDFMRDAGDDEDDDDENDEGDLDQEIPKIYEPVYEKDAVKERLTTFINRYNMQNRRRQLDLVLFQDAIEHVLRISRIIRTPLGNALLVGVGGSGKQSLTRLASFIAGYQTFQIVITRNYNINNFDDDLKVLYRIAGVEGKGVTFLFTDNEVKEEVFLERINNILTSGEVPALFQKDEVEIILNDIRPSYRKEFPRGAGTNDMLWNYFLDRVKANLHVVLCFSPVGEKFRNRARKFPGLISGCTTDWFQPWPEEALTEVSDRFLGSFEELVATDEIKQSLIQHFATVHGSMNPVTEEYFGRFRRHTYVTPKSYLSFLQSFRELYTQKKSELSKLSTRLNSGLSKLVNAAAGVANMQVELNDKKKDLAVAQEKTQKMLVEITSQTTIAEKKKSEVQAVKDALQKDADIIAHQKAMAEEGLAKALPALEAAERALNSIKPGDIATLKALAKPPNLIMRIMDAVLILSNKPIDPIRQDPNFPERMLPSWSHAVKMIGDIQFLQNLLSFEREAITNEHCELLLPYIDMADFNIESARKSSGNVAGLIQWVMAMDTYHKVALEVEPKRRAMREAEAKYSVAMAELAKAQAELDEKQAALDALRAKYDEAMAEKQRLQDDAELTERRLNSATALINGLSGERTRWGQQSKDLDENIRRLVGDVALASAFLSYAGPFNQEFRIKLLNDVWLTDINQKDIPISDGIQDRITRFLVPESTVGEWNLQGLPTDDLSTQNGIIVTTAQRYPLLIDPQGQAVTWIKNREAPNGLKVTNLNDKFFRQNLEDSLNFGTPILIEDVGEELDPVLDTILEKQFEKSGKKLKVRVGDKECDVEDGFYLFITTKIANPHYSPETFAKTSVIDFTVTFGGLEAQLLTRTVNLERKELEEQRQALLEEVNRNKKKAEQLEEDLLFRLSSTKGNLLDDTELIDVLAKTKVTTEEVQEKLKSAATMEIRINDARSEYLSVATRGSILYFLIAEMSLVSHMYQTSLVQFLIWFDEAIKAADTSPITSKRITAIISTLTFNVFQYISRGLFENHKMLFVLLLTLKIDLKAENISHNEFNTFIKGGAALDINTVRRKPGAWIPDNAWLNIIALSDIPAFSALPAQISDAEATWRRWYDEEEPENSELPPEYQGVLTQFQKLLLVRSLREDRAMLAATDYIIEALGERYAESVSTDVRVLENVLENISPTTPLVFLLSLGSDPSSMVEGLAKRNKISLSSISMGQGQEVHARALISEGFENGGWVLISNSHLGLKFMEELETILSDREKEEDPPNKNFRLILTTEPHDKFPIGLLQRSIKLTNDPPTGCRAGLRRSYQMLTQDQLETVDKPQWLPLVYVIAFIHTTVQERRKYGPLGWCIPYEFGTPDFSASIQFLQTYLYGLDPHSRKGPGISYSTIRYMISEVHYGGRVTDDYDRRLLKTYAEEWLHPRVFQDDFEFYTGYAIPKYSNIVEARASIEQLPLLDKPQVYGLHANAELTYRAKQANEVLGTILSIQPKDASAGGGESREDVVLKLTKDILSKLPPDYSRLKVKEQIKRLGGNKNPLNVFLGQEVDRMQRVLFTLRSTLTDLQLAIAGTIIMSQTLQEVLDSLFDARVPESWLKVSWPSATLGFWLSDVISRADQYTAWLEKGKPKSFWMTGFFNSTGFLTSMKQELTRLHKWPLDQVNLRTSVMKFVDKSQVTQPPEEGVYIHGLFLDGAAWDRRTMRLVDQPPKILFTPLPVLHVSAANTPLADTSRLYQCPVYKTANRTDLNYIFHVWLPTEDAPKKWIMRGTALLCSTT